MDISHENRAAELEMDNVQMWTGSKVIKFFHAQLN